MQPYYDYFSQLIYFRSGASSSRSHITVPAPLGTLPLFHRGGSILTRRDLIRRAAPLMWRDPITLVVALDKSGKKASGDIYLDDGDSFDYEKGEIVWRGFTLSRKDKKTLILESKDLVSSYSGASKVFARMAASYDSNNAFARKISRVTVDEIVVLGLLMKPACVRLKGASTGLAFEWQGGIASTARSRNNGQPATVLRVKGALLPVTQDWLLEFDFDTANACMSKPPLASLASLEDPTCPGSGQARCRNKGHISACVLISRINDGICDSECCDGSDETDGKVHCPDRCSEVNKAYRAEVDEGARVRRVGAKIRKDWAAYGQKEKLRIEQSIRKIEAELGTFLEKEKQLKVVLERVEKSEAGDIERKRASKLYQRIKEHQTSVQSLRKHRAYLQDQVGDLITLLSDLKKSFNPNYQDMAVLGSVRAFDEWRRKTGYDITDGPAVGTDEGKGSGSEQDGNTITPIEVDFDDLPDEKLISLEEEDVISLMSELETAGPAQEAANMRK